MFKRLEYVTPVAFQTMITPISDLEGELINNLFDTEPTSVVEPIYLCCFPMGDGSVIIVFHHRRTTRFNTFDKQFTALSEEEQLLAVLKLALSYSEDVFFSPVVGDTIREDAGIGALCRMNVDSLGIRPCTPNKQLDLLTLREATMSKYALVSMPVIPNLLDAVYALG